MSCKQAANTDRLYTDLTQSLSQLLMAVVRNPNSIPATNAMSKVTLKGIQKIDPTSQSQNIGGTSGVNLEINDKELLVLAGPTGSGKSGLLRLIAGLDEASKGEILLGEKKVDGVSPGEREVALITDSPVLFEEKTISQNLVFGMNLRNVPDQEKERRVKEAASILELEAILEKEASEVSVPERIKTVLGRALVRQPKLILLDAPFGRVNASEQGRLRADLIRIQERTQATMLYATSDPMEAFALGNRIAAIHKGEIQQVDSPGNIYGLPANLFVAGFFGAPGMNLVQGTLKRVGETLQFREQGEGTIECKITQPNHALALTEYAGKEIVLGLRPEHIQPALVETASKTRIKGLAELIEPRGGETLIHFQTGVHHLTARSDSFMDRAEAGHRMQFEVELGEASYFDPVSTLRVFPK